jgi:iron complex outermembrane receptor protein
MPTHRQVPIFVLGLALCPSIGAQSPDSKPEEDVPLLPRVEVVGSRIRRVDLETSQPVLVLERAQLERTGLDSVGDILQDLTAHGAALNTTVNNGGDGTTRVDLRNLGDQRTLVLVDGRRWITGIDGAVDLNSIPLSIIERIEVL